MGSACARRVSQIALQSVVLLTLMPAPYAMSQEYRLEYRLEAVGDPSPQNANIKFILTNKGQDSVRILPWNTPFTGAISSRRMFEISCGVNGKEESPSFEGPLRHSSKAPPERGKQSAEDSLDRAMWIGPGESRQTVVDLASAYRLPANGSCKVAFTGLLTVLVNDDPGPNKQPEFAFTNARGEPLTLAFKA